MKFINYLKKLMFPTIVALSALSVSGSAAFYSITGLSKLFAGATLEVIIMATSLEVSKLVIASLLYNYWGVLNKLLKTYLTIAAFILIMITSMGIYGFLSAAYQETASKAVIIDKEIELLDVKRSRFIENRDYYLGEKKTLDKSIGNLRDGLANNKIQYKDRETGVIITTTSSSNRKVFEKQLEDALVNRDEVSIKLEQATDSISNIDVKILEIESNSDITSELGPLKYLSELTDLPMNKIINYLLLVIIFVFDPLAIALVIAANFLFNKINKINKKDEETEENISSKVLKLVEEEVKVVEEEVKVVEEEVKLVEEEANEVVEEEANEVVEEEVNEVVEEEVNEVVEEEVNEVVEEEVNEVVEEESKITIIEKNTPTEYTEVEQPEENKIKDEVVTNKKKRLVYQKRDAR